MSPTTPLLRQAHPNFMAGGEITSQVFMPFPKDDGSLSVYDGDQCSPADAYEHYTQVLCNQSAGGWSVTKAEADGAGAEGRPDPLPDFPAHAAIDFGGIPEKDRRKVAKRLKALASSRGCQYWPE
jgi:hypothetical protein